MAPTRKLPRPFSFPWGGGQIVEEVFVESEHHVPTIQLLEYEDGSLSVRFCSYTHSGRFQRNPVMMSADDMKGLAVCVRRLRDGAACSPDSSVRGRRTRRRWRRSRGGATPASSFSVASCSSSTTPSIFASGCG